jgi:hypothetical protein
VLRQCARGAARAARGCDRRRCRAGVGASNLLQRIRRSPPTRRSRLAESHRIAELEPRQRRLPAERRRRLPIARETHRCCSAVDSFRVFARPRCPAAQGRENLQIAGPESPFRRLHHRPLSTSEHHFRGSAPPHLVPFTERPQNGLANATLRSPPSNCDYQPSRLPASAQRLSLSRQGRLGCWRPIFPRCARSARSAGTPPR